MSVTIRAEEGRDQHAICALTARAFATMPYADGDEQDVIDRLRAAGALSVSLVAEQGGTVIGQVTFSPAIAASGNAGWFTLGPVSVDPEFQKAGIGAQLINAGLAQLRDSGAAGCILVGNPAFYARFGFALAPDYAPDEGHAQYFQLLAFGDAQPSGVFGFHPAFAG